MLSSFYTFLNHYHCDSQIVQVQIKYEQINSKSKQNTNQRFLQTEANRDKLSQQLEEADDRKANPKNPVETTYEQIASYIGGGCEWKDVFYEMYRNWEKLYSRAHQPHEDTTRKNGMVPKAQGDELAEFLGAT